MTDAEYNYIEKILIQNAEKIKRLALQEKVNPFSGPVQSVDHKEKLSIYTNVDSVSRSGMMRWISLYMVIDGEILSIVSLPAYEKAHNGKYDLKKEAWKMTGCGMDMGFALVYSIASFYGHDDRERNLDMGYSINQRRL